jgi:predicted TIM-barrel fold metal-dependent hydrolase
MAIVLVKETNNIYVDISFAEKLDTIVSLLEEIPAKRILFVSHTPFLYTQSAAMKTKAVDISKNKFDAIAGGNALNLVLRQKY